MDFGVHGAFPPRLPTLCLAPRHNPFVATAPAQAGETGEVGAALPVQVHERTGLGVPRWLGQRVRGKRLLHVGRIGGEGPGYQDLSRDEQHGRSVICSGTEVPESHRVYRVDSTGVPLFNITTIWNFALAHGVAGAWS